MVAGASMIAGCNGDGDTDEEPTDGSSDTESTGDETETDPSTEDEPESQTENETDQQPSDFYENHPWPMPHGGSGWSRYTPHGDGIGPEYEQTWTTTVDNPANGARPLVTQNHLLIFDNSGTAYGLELGDGTIDWDTDIGFTPNRTPIVHEGRIVVPGESQIVGLALDDGSETWRQEIDIPDEDRTRLTWGTAVDGAVFVGIRYESDLYAIEVSDGSTRWHRTIDNWVYNGPVGESGTIVFSTRPEGGIQQGVPQLIGFDTESGEQTWAVDQNEDDEIFKKPLISDGVAHSGYYIEDGFSSLTAVDVETGDVLVSDIVGPDPPSWPVKAADPEKLYYGGKGGWIDKQSLLSGQTPGDAYTENPSVATAVAITGSYIYTRQGGSTFHIVDKDGFEQVGTIESNWELTAPVVGGERVYVASQRGEVIAYE